MPISPIVDRLLSSWNTHDLAALADCLHSDAISEHPAHPERNAIGREAICRRWALTFAAVPDLTARLIRHAVTDDGIWTEWAFTGGSSYRGGGVMILSLRDDRIARLRVFTEAQPLEGPDWDQVIADVLASGPE
ncbi:MAG TPA: nuclear transport factor 2 family protein [Anaerolineales bacterium]|nr:nuclear transport factor 2 family protein [Anaerolineales bacterium]HRF46517.1 nuclear transport factor 2 family protein [Anaerolineales bacterium]